jgi:hypothetical protein
MIIFKEHEGRSSSSYHDHDDPSELCAKRGHHF